MTTPRYYFNTQSFGDLAGLCSRFTGKRLQSPTRSTVPLLDLVHNNRGEWNRLLEKLGALPDSTVHFEFKVPSPKPRGNPSQTDALLESETSVWAIEAKWTEPTDLQTVTKRLSKPETDGGDPYLTINGWLAHIQPFARRPLQTDDFTDVIYQMVHRAASAAYVAGERGLRPELVYLHFVPSPPKSRPATTRHYISDLTRLYERLGRPAGFRFHVVEMPLAPSAAFELIKDLDKHSPATSQRVREALCNGPLFQFGEPMIQRI